MAHWEANTSIRFVQRTNQANYVIFVGDPNSTGGASDLGMIGGPQYVVHGPNMGTGVVIHEIGHVVGLMHEQCRADRDQYINVNYNNIHNNYKYQYDTYIVKAISGGQLGPFDFSSVMLYMPYSSVAAINGSTVPQLTKKDGSLWGYNSILSYGDIEGVKYLYEPVYAKFIGENNPADSYYYTSVTNEDVRDSHNYFVEFYSDPSFQNRVTLSHPITINVNFYYNELSSGYGSYRIQTTIPAGVDRQFIGTGFKEYSAEYGNYRAYREEVLTGLLPGIGYKY